MSARFGLHLKPLFPNRKTHKQKRFCSFSLVGPSHPVWGHMLVSFDATIFGIQSPMISPQKSILRSCEFPIKLIYKLVDFGFEYLNLGATKFQKIKSYKNQNMCRPKCRQGLDYYVGLTSRFRSRPFQATPPRT